MSSIWNDDYQCVVTLIFDIDGPSATLLRNPELADHPSAVSIGEFGPKVGTERIRTLLDRHYISATYFVPGWVSERNQETVKEVAYRGHEVANHGYLHEPPSSLGTDESQADILDRGSDILESITGERPQRYRSTSCEISKDSLRLMHERVIAVLEDGILLWEKNILEWEFYPNNVSVKPNYDQKC